MFKLYLNNFRGFSDTLINFKDVNFLVGENSTGKTSIIKAINMISKQLNLDMYDTKTLEDDFSIWKYEDITYNDSFNIGLVKYISNKNDYIFLNFNFIEENGKPIISGVDFCDKNISIYVENNLKVQNGNFLSMNYEYYLGVHNYEDLQNDNKLFYKFNKTLNKENAKEIALPRNIPLSFLISFIIEKENINDKNIDIFLYNFIDILNLSPIRSEAKYLYEPYKLRFSSSGDHTPLLLKQLLNSNDNDSIRILNKFGITSGLFESIEIDKLVNTDEDSPFQIKVKINNIKHNITNVGYGLSQILPLLIEPLINIKLLYSLQQPEVHLHPRAQSGFGEYLYNISNKKSKKFIVETHSDFLIDKYRLMINKKKTNINSQILYFEKTKSGNKVHQIDILDNGDLSENQPIGFRNFFIKEKLQLLSLN